MTHAEDTATHGAHEQPREPEEDRNHSRPPTSYALPPGCDHCASERREPLLRGPDRLRGLPGEFAFVRCAGCGLLYQWPRLPWEQLEAYYEGDYSAYARLPREEPSPLRRAFYRRGPRKRRRYVERFARRGRLLDVGCGTGMFLDEMQASGRWQVAGVEPTRQAAAYAGAALGVAISTQVFEQAELPPASFDVITLWHVLEHVASPRATLAQAWRLLRPGGYCIFSIPNYESWGRRLFGRFWVGWDLPRHLYCFPRPVLRAMVERAGFELVDDACFLIGYEAFGHSLTFWAQSWPPRLQPLARLLRGLYYSLPVRAALYPLQLVVQRLGAASVTTWAARKVSHDGSV